MSCGFSRSVKTHILQPQKELFYREAGHHFVNFRHDALSYLGGCNCYRIRYQ